MKTTIELPNALLEEARRVAREGGVSLRVLLEAGLRRELAARDRREAFALRDASFEGRGLVPGVAEGGWDRILDTAYSGRGA